MSLTFLTDYYLLSVLRMSFSVFYFHKKRSTLLFFCCCHVQLERKSGELRFSSVKPTKNQARLSFNQTFVGIFRATPKVLTSSFSIPAKNSILRSHNFSQALKTKRKNLIHNFEIPLNEKRGGKKTIIHLHLSG